MNILKTLSSSLVLIVFISSCKNNSTTYDASGAFEAEEVIISSGAIGNILQFNVEEGQVLQAGQFLGYVDSIQLSLKKQQVESQVKALLSRKPDIAAQLSALQEQLKTSEREKLRINNLVKADAATTKQLDDINAQIEIIRRQIDAQKSTLEISSTSITKDAGPLYSQIDQLEDQITKCRIINPINGTVLTKYAQAHEMTNTGKALYKIADLSTIILRVYISGNQLAQVKLNQKVTVLTDDGNGGFKSKEGVVSWINEKAEFTPKTIQTKDERANMVYAVKVKVQNDGSYKIGMYGQIKFN